MKLLIICLTLVELILFLTFFIVIFTPFWYLFAIIFILIAALFFVVSVLFYEYTKKYLKKNRKALIDFNIKKNAVLSGNDLTVIFKKKNDIWISENSENETALDLREYFFQKSFIKAFLIRCVRYPIISKTLPLHNLFKYKMGVGKIYNLNLKMIDGEKEYNYQIVFNGISKNNLLTRNISKSSYHTCFYTQRSLLYLTQTIKINEEIYLPLSTTDE